jgi:hypothetical protein
MMSSLSPHFSQSKQHIITVKAEGNLKKKKKTAGKKNTVALSV